MPVDQEAVDQLECHFKWTPEESDDDADPQTTIEHLLKTIDEFPDIKMLNLNVIAYLYARLEQIDKAIEYLDDVIECCTGVSEEQCEEYKGYELVASNNKIKALCLNGEHERAEELLKTVLQGQKLPDKSRASMYGCHGYALSLFGKENFGKSLAMYQKAIELDPGHYCWRVGLAFVTGRIRRLTEGSQTLATPAEKNALEKAVELSNREKALPMVLLADIYFIESRDFSKKGQVADNRMMKKAKKLYEKAFELAHESPHVLKRCGKAFHVMGDEDRGLKCLVAALKLDPYSSVTLHRLGQANEFSAKNKNFEAAEGYYHKAVIAGRRRNFFAELDLARIKKKLDVKYDLRQHYETMKVHYMEDEKRAEYLEAKIKDVEEHGRNYREKRKGRKRGRGRGKGEKGKEKEGKGEEKHSEVTSSNDKVTNGD